MVYCNHVVKLIKSKFIYDKQIEFSESNRSACCPDIWQSLWGCHRVQFSGWLFSVYQWCRFCCGWFFDPPLCRWHHSVYIWPFFGHCVTNLQTSFNALQHSIRDSQLLLNASKTKWMLFNRLLPAPVQHHYSGWFWLRICGQLQIPRCLARL